MTVLRRVSLLALVLVLAGCSSSSDSSSDEPGTTMSTPTSTTSNCTPPSDAALTARTSPALKDRETMYLTDVEVEAEDCIDRVTFEFEKAKPGPGFEVSYRPASVAKVEDASGKHLAIAGNAFLVVRLFPAMTAKINGEDVEPTYTGPRRITPDGANHVQQVVKTGDFEALVTWVIGLDQKRPFTTDATESKLVVEIG
jgi:hypothetical protein